MAQRSGAAKAGLSAPSLGSPVVSFVSGALVDWQLGEGGRFPVSDSPSTGVTHQGSKPKKKNKKSCVAPSFLALPSTALPLLSWSSPPLPSAPVRMS